MTQERMFQILYDIITTEESIMDDEFDSKYRLHQYIIHHFKITEDEYNEIMAKGERER